MAEKSILLTGGAGYIGSHCVLQLLNDGYKTVVLDNCSNAYLDKQQEKPESILRIEKLTGKTVHYVQGDLQNYGDLEKVFSQHSISCVIHCAALKSVSESMEIPLTYYSNNVSGSINLLRVMEKFGVKDFIFSSSSTVYGNPKFLPLTEDHPTGIELANSYGRTKFIVEEILKDTSKADKSWRIYSLRYFNPVGAHPSGEIGEDPLGLPNNLMPVVAQVAVGKIKSLKVYGNDYDTVDGTGVRDYIHIMDLAKGHAMAVKHLFTESQNSSIFKAYNLGNGYGCSVLEVVRTFEKVNNIKIPYTIVGRRLGDIASSYCEVSLAKNELNWEATCNLEDMCRDTWKWQSKNPNGFRKN